MMCLCVHTRVHIHTPTHTHTHTHTHCLLFFLEISFPSQTTEGPPDNKSLFLVTCPYIHTHTHARARSHTLSLSPFFSWKHPLPLRPQRSQPDPCCSQSAGQQRHMAGAGLHEDRRGDRGDGSKVPTGGRQERRPA